MSDPNIDAASYLKALHAAIDKAIASGTLEKEVHHQAKTQNVEELEGSTIINQVAASPYTIVDEPKENDDDDSTELTDGDIAGIVIGVLVAVGLLCYFNAKNSSRDQPLLNSK